MRKCWRADKTRRPRIGEVVKGVDVAAASWQTDMQPSGPEQQEDSFVEDESDIDHGVFALIYVVVAFVLRLCLQLDYLNGMRVGERPIRTLVPTPRVPAAHSPQGPNELRLNLLKNLESNPCTNT